MKTGRLPWFPCEPRELLSALTGLDPDAKLVYLITLLRIYEDGKPVEEDADSLSNRTLLPRARVQKALDLLLSKRKLITADHLLSNEKAEQVIAQSRKVQKERSERASGAAKSRYEKIEVNQQNGDADAMLVPAQEQGHQQENKDSPRSARTRRPRSADDYTEEFDQKVWQPYPRQRGTSKKNAFKQWNKLSDAQRATVIRVMPTWRALMSKRDEDKIKHLEFYLTACIFETLEQATIIARDESTVTDPKHFSDTRWTSLVNVYRATNDWKQAWGPPPGSPGCLLPQKIQQQISKATLDTHSAQA